MPLKSCMMVLDLGANTMSTNANFCIFALSDATGELAHNLAISASNQFPKHNANIVKVPKIHDKAGLKKHVLRAKEVRGVIVFTFVSNEMRQELLNLSKENEVVAIDVLGPILGAFSNYFHELPSTEPGLQYKLTQNYFKRTEAVEFTVKHDDGLGLSSIVDADVVLLGVSRTSKTPLSIYLAYQGYRCANIPLVHNMPLPKVFDTIDPKKMVGLTISPLKLAMIRSERLKKLGRPETEVYAQMEHVKEELTNAMRLFQDLGILIVDVTGKAIEEIASDIINTLKI